MSPETVPDIKEQAEQLFRKLWDEASKDGSFIEISPEYSKQEFLMYLAEHQDVLFHGSNWEIDELEPRQGNCRSKKFGNLKAVYATKDPIFPLFFAIKDKERFDGSALTGSYGSKAKGNLQYEFKVEQKMLDERPWSDGTIYILPRNLFEQGVDDQGKPIDEFASQEPVKPLAKLRVTPEDFPYLNDIEVYQQS